MVPEGPARGTCCRLSCLNDSSDSGKSITHCECASPFPSAPADLELIAQLKSKLQYAELRIRVLEERLRLMRIEKYGAGGEKLSQAQMQLFELEPVVSEMIEQAESEHAPVHRPTKKSGKHPGRQELPANLPRVERVLPCTPDQRVCKRCGKETVVIGYEESSQLDVEPAKYFVLVTKREKRACRSCEDLGVVSAPLPPRIIEKCLASDQIVIETVVSKYCNHLPLHRQERFWKGTSAWTSAEQRWTAGSKSRRVAHPDGRGDEARVGKRSLHTGGRNPGGCADARRPREKSSSLFVAVRPTRRKRGVRFPLGSRTGRTEAVPEQYVVERLLLRSVFVLLPHRKRPSRKPPE